MSVQVKVITFKAAVTHNSERWS